MKRFVQLCAGLLLAISATGCCCTGYCDPCGYRGCLLRDIFHPFRHFGCGCGCGGSACYGVSGCGCDTSGVMMPGGFDGCGCGDTMMPAMQAMPATPAIPAVPNVPTYSTPTPSPSLQTPPPAPGNDLSRISPQRQQQILSSHAQGPVQVSVEEFNALPGVPTAQPAGWTPTAK